MSLFSKKKPTGGGGVINAIKPTIAIINATTVLKDSQITPVVQAMQVAITRDFAPLWGIDAALVQVPKGANPPAGAWWMVLIDNLDVQGALGYHDLTSEDLPIGKIGVQTCIDDNSPWSTCLGHEIYEALADPWINQSAQDNNGIFYAFENSDAVEAQSYQINGVPMTNFVTPAWFQPLAPLTSKFDFLGLVKRPFELLPGGYISALDPSNSTGWIMLTADRNKATLLDMRPRLGSRRQRRQIGHANWVRSTAHPGA